LPFTRINGLGCATPGFALVAFGTGGFKNAFGFATAFGFAFAVTVATALVVVAVTVVGVVVGGVEAGGVTAAGGVMAQLSFPGIPSLPALPSFAHGCPPIGGTGGGGGAGGGCAGGAGGGSGGGGGGDAWPQLSDCVLEAEPPPSAVHAVEALTVASPVRLSATTNVPLGPVIVKVPDASVLPLAVTV
jgi:hypothetical protein